MASCWLDDIRLKLTIIVMEILIQDQAIMEIFISLSLTQMHQSLCQKNF